MRAILGAAREVGRARDFLLRALLPPPQLRASFASRRGFPSHLECTSRRKGGKGLACSLPCYPFGSLLPSLPFSLPPFQPLRVVPSLPLPLPLFGRPPRSKLPSTSLQRGISGWESSACLAGARSCSPGASKPPFRSASPRSVRLGHRRRRCHDGA